MAEPIMRLLAAKFWGYDMYTSFFLNIYKWPDLLLLDTVVCIFWVFQRYLSPWCWRQGTCIHLRLDVISVTDRTIASRAHSLFSLLLAYLLSLWSYIVHADELLHFDHSYESLMCTLIFHLADSADPEQRLSNVFPSISWHVISRESTRILEPHLHPKAAR